MKGVDDLLPNNAPIILYQKQQTQRNNKPDMNAELNLPTLFRMILGLALCVAVAGLGLYPFTEQQSNNSSEELDNSIAG